MEQSGLVRRLPAFIAASFQLKFGRLRLRLSGPFDQKMAH
jgi:hypothetical protein